MFVGFSFSSHITDAHALLNAIAIPFVCLCIYNRASRDLPIGPIDINGLMELPLSVQSADLTKFTTIVSRFQQSAGITDTCRVGVLCNETSAYVQKLLRRRSTFS